MLDTIIDSPETPVSVLAHRHGAHLLRVACPWCRNRAGMCVKHYHARERCSALARCPWTGNVYMLADYDDSPSPLLIIR